jgi:hypothetical protein
LTNEQCRFCHILAQNDGSPKGVFFPRYQESYKARILGDTNLLFHADHFTLMPAQSASKLGLPTDVKIMYRTASNSYDYLRLQNIDNLTPLAVTANAPPPPPAAKTLCSAIRFMPTSVKSSMTEDFLYQKVDVSLADEPPENTGFARILMELPQLVEVMARDNKQSMCVAVDFGGILEHAGFGRNDYVCADNAAQHLSVKLTNSSLTVNKGPKQYSEPYFEKK